MDEVDATSLAGGLALIAVGAVLLVDTTGVVDLGFGWLSPLLLGAAGVVLVASGTAARGRRTPAPPRPRRPAAAPGPLARVWQRLTDGTLFAGHHQPRRAAELQERYRVGLGTLDLDLSRLELSPGTTEVHARMGIGTIVVTAPRHGRVVVHARATAGHVELLGRSDTGVPAALTVDDGEPPEPCLVVHASVDLGTVDVSRPA